MSRHRNIRGRTFSYDDDYQDDDQWDSGSEYAMSPNSQRYMYNRSQKYHQAIVYPPILAENLSTPCLTHF